MRRQVGRILLIGALLAFTLSLHYGWLPVPHSIHLLHRRLCYIPIILGALWFGLRGGVGVALAISLAVAPLAWGESGPLWGNEEVVEIVFYLGIGALAGFLVDRGHREREMKRLLEMELAEAERLATAGRTAAGIAHEVRTPLASVRGAVEILAEDYGEGHPRRPYYDILVQETGRLKQVMDEFLDLNRPIVLAPGPVDLGPFLGECAAALRPEAATRGVELRLETEGTRAFTMDRERMRQVVTNLLRNALQACPRGGSVRLLWKSGGDGLSIAVEDDGPGVAPDERERVFEPFFTRKREGVGLGLSLARQIVAAHGGTLRAEEAPGGGARFVLRIPSESPR